MFVNVSLVSIGISKRQVIVIYSFKLERFVLVCGLWLTRHESVPVPDLGRLKFIVSLCSSNRIIRPSVCCMLSVSPRVRNFVPLTNKVQFIKFALAHSNHTCTGNSQRPYFFLQIKLLRTSYISFCRVTFPLFN